MAQRSRLRRQIHSRVWWHRRLGTCLRIGKLIGIFLLFMALMTALFMLAEGHGRDEGDEDFWKILVYFFTGFGDDPPQTAPGRAIAILVFVVGIVLVATLTGGIASYLVKQNLEFNMPEHMSKHFVICNWNDRADRIVSELHSEQGAPNSEIIVIANQDVNQTQYRGKAEYENVTFIKSDPSLHDVLRVCNAHHAQAVVIIADEEFHSEDPDGNSALIALAIRRLCDDGKIPPPHIVSEALDHRRIAHLRDAGVHEVVCAHDFGLGILAQSSLHPGLSEVYNRLLTYSDATNEIYIVDDVPEIFHGLTFADASVVFANNRCKGNPSILIGVKRGTDIYLNARQDERQREKLGEIRDGDSLIAISFDPPDLKRFNGTAHS